LPISEVTIVLIVFVQRLFSLSDVFTFFRLVSIDLDVTGPFFGHFIFVENRFDRAFRHASFAIDALIGVDVEHRVAFVKALDWANDNAIGVAATITRLGDNMSH
jgi:hypothetical protein